MAYQLFKSSYAALMSSVFFNGVKLLFCGRHSKLMVSIKTQVEVQAIEIMCNPQWPSCHLNSCKNIVWGLHFCLYVPCQPYEATFFEIKKCFREYPPISTIFLVISLKDFQVYLEVSLVSAPNLYEHAINHLCRGCQKMGKYTHFENIINLKHIYSQTY